MQNQPKHRVEVGDIDLAWESEMRPRVPPEKELLTLDDVYRALFGHRYEVLTALALFGPLNVTGIAERLNLSTRIVSRVLIQLQTTRLVEYIPVKSNHLYRLTERVVAFKWRGKAQLTLQVPSGDWATSHREEFSDPGCAAIKPPSSFIDPGAPNHANVANAVALVKLSTEVKPTNWTPQRERVERSPPGRQEDRSRTKQRTGKAPSRKRSSSAKTNASGRRGRGP